MYNEESMLTQALLTLDSFGSNNIGEYEVLIIESGSQDHSATICDTIAAERQNTRVIHEGQRNGFGSALKLGYKEASKKWI